MLKYCVRQWDKNKDRLRAVIEQDKNLHECDYTYLVKLVVDYIFNDVDGKGYEWNSDGITEIDNGDYQGTLLWMIPLKTYQPNEGDYLLTFVNYGSCSGCDTLQHIQMLMGYEEIDESIVKMFMNLCKDLVCNTVKPYNSGWRAEEIFGNTEV